MAVLSAYFQTDTGAPLVSPATTPTILVVRSDNTVDQAATAMTELANAPGWYVFTFATVDAREYVFTCDGDPIAAGQVPATGRYVTGVVSGTVVERVEVDVPAILVDTDALETRLTALRAANLDEVTALRMAELDPANVPADIDTLISRLTALRAANLDEVTAVRMAELDAANLPADVDTLLSRLTALRAAALDEITAVRMAELDAANLPADIDTLLGRLTAIRAGLLDNLTNLDALVSSRAAPGDAMALTPAERAAIDAALSATHGAGSWVGTSSQDWSGPEREQIREALGVDGTKTAATGGQIQEIAADVAELNDVKITTARANALDEVTAARLSELDPANIPADIDVITARTADLEAALAFFGAVIASPVTHTPTTVTAGGFSWSVVVAGPNVTFTRLT